MDKLSGPLRLTVRGAAASLFAFGLSACWLLDAGAPPPPMGVDSFEVPTTFGPDVVPVVGDLGDPIDIIMDPAPGPLPLWSSQPSPPSTAPSSPPPPLPFGGLIPWTPSQTMIFDDTKSDNGVPPIVVDLVPGNPGPPPVTFPFNPFNGWSGGRPPPSMTPDPNGTSITYNPQPGGWLVFTPPPQIPDPPPDPIPEAPPRLYLGSPDSRDFADALYEAYIADTLTSALLNYILQTSGIFPPTTGWDDTIPGVVGDLRDPGWDQTVPGVVGDLRGGDDVLPNLGHLGGGQPIPQGTNGWPTGLGYDTPHGPLPMPVNTGPGPTTTPTPATTTPSTNPVLPTPQTSTTPSPESSPVQLPQHATAPTTGPATTPSTIPSNAPTTTTPSSGPPTSQTSTTSNPGLPTATPSPTTRMREQVYQEAISPSGLTTTPSSPNNASSPNRKDELWEQSKREASKSLTTAPVTTPAGEGATPSNVRKQEMLEEFKPGSASSTPSHGVSSEREHSVITREAPQDMHSVTQERGSSRPEEFAPGSRTMPRTDPGRETAFGSRSTPSPMGGSGGGPSPSSGGFASPGGPALGGHSFGGGGSGGPSPSSGGFASPSGPALGGHSFGGGGSGGPAASSPMPMRREQFK